MTLHALYKTLKAKLDEASIDHAALEARLIWRAVTGRADPDLIACADDPVPAGAVDAAGPLLARRLGGEPLSRIFGEREFWGLPFTVTPDVLDPRPDTETLVEAALKLFKARPPARILDLGTGSGCLITALLHEWTGCQGVAVDISEKALAVAGANAARNGVAERLDVRQGNWFEVIGKEERFDLIVSNPPYIPNPDLAGLDREVRNHDPILALDGGIDGLDSYRIIFSGLDGHFSEDGIALFEIGAGQQDDLERLAGNAGLKLSRVYPDLSGIPRVLEIGRGDK